MNTQTPPRSDISAAGGRDGAKRKAVMTNGEWLWCAVIVLGCLLLLRVGGVDAFVLPARAAASALAATWWWSGPLVIIAGAAVATLVLESVIQSVAEWWRTPPPAAPHSPPLHPAGAFFGINNFRQSKPFGDASLGRRHEIEEALSGRPVPAAAPKFKD